jgi:hypothetical protein
MAKQGSIKVPTRESEDKRTREEDAAHQRLNENGRSILTMWMLGFMIQENRSNFQLTRECLQIIATFSNFTNLAESGIEFDEDDMQILRDFAEEIKREYFHNNVGVHEGFNCRDLWKSFLQAYWISDGFLRFEAKFAPKLVLPFFKRDDGATLVLSDNLFLLDKLTKFLKKLSMLPTLTQRMSSFYASSGLTVIEKAKLLFSERQGDHMKHQLKIVSAKLKAANDALKEAKEKYEFLQMLYEKMRVQNQDYADQIDSMQKELDASRIAIKKLSCDSLPMCNVCYELYIDKSSPLKIASCCGNLLCCSCFDLIKKINYARHGDTPPCPCCCASVICLVPIIDDHPTIRNVGRKLKANAETTTDPDVFLEFAIGGPEIEPIPKPSRPPSIYAQLLGDQRSVGPARAAAGGGGAARPNPHHRREPPAARGDA